MQKARALSFNGELPLQSCSEAWPDQYCLKRPRRHHQLQQCLPHYNAQNVQTASVGHYVDVMQDDDALLKDVPARMRLLYDYRAPAGTRWSPTREQLRELQALFHVAGIRTPTTAQISRITARLRRFGRIEGRNVFYWFQNQKARERKMKLNQQQLAMSAGEAGAMSAVEGATSADDVSGVGPCDPGVQGATVSSAISCPSDFCKAAELSSSSLSAGAADDTVNNNGAAEAECSQEGPFNVNTDGDDCRTTGITDGENAMLELQLWPAAANHNINHNYIVLINETDSKFNAISNHNNQINHQSAEEEVSEVSDVAPPVNGDIGLTSCRFSEALQDDKPIIQCANFSAPTAVMSSSANFSPTVTINYSKLQGSVQKLQGDNRRLNGNNSDDENNMQNLRASYSTAPPLQVLFPLSPESANHPANQSVNHSVNLSANHPANISGNYSANHHANNSANHPSNCSANYPHLLNDDAYYNSNLNPNRSDLHRQHGQLRKQYSTTSLDLSLAI